MEWTGRARRKRDREAAARLVEEAGAFLAGRYVEVSATPGSELPSWAHLNRIAHAPPESLVAPGGSLEGSATRPGSWEWAVEVVRRELVVLTGGDATRVRDLQWGCLVPLELTMMQPVFWHLLPSEVAALARSRLRAHPSVRRQGRLPVPPSEEQ